MTITKNKAVKYLVLLIVSLLLMLFGSVLITPFALMIFKSVGGYGNETITEAVNALQNYFSTDKYNDAMTWAEYAQTFFEADPVLFNNTKTFYCALQFFSYIPLLIVIIFFLREEFAEDFIDFKKNIKKNLIYIGLGIVAMYVCSYIVAIIYEIIGVTGDSANESLINLLLDSSGAALMIVAVVILAPISEEVIFRKLLMGTCEKTFHFPPTVAIIVSALVFSFIHVTDLASLKFIFQYIALALPICIVYHYSNNNIYVTMIMHFINNLISVIVTMATL